MVCQEGYGLWAGLGAHWVREYSEKFNLFYREDPNLCFVAKLNAKKCSVDNELALATQVGCVWGTALYRQLEHV